MKLKFILSLFLILNLSFGFSQTVKTKETKKRPSVGLVLSGGGAKGFAYIGILKAIQKAGLPIDYIGGTSMGSIMGSLYALGYNPDTITKIIRAQNWDRLLKDKPERKYLAFEEKSFAENNITELPFTGKKIELKASLYEGQQINLLLNKYLSVGYKTTDFSKLPTPFLCMGTNILNGKSVLLNSGYLPMAVRASMSIPGYFAPTHFQGKYLVDGGVIDNYPAVQVKKMGADFIVGADVQHGLIKNIKQLNSVTKVLEQITSFARVKANKAGYKVTDLYMPIKMKYEMMDFDDYDSIIAVGEQAAKKYYPALKSLADSLNDIEYRPVKKHNTTPLDSLNINQIYYEGFHHITEKLLDNFFAEFRHSRISVAELEDRIRLAYGTSYFKYINYELKLNGNKTDLIIKVKEASPGALGMAVHYDSDYQGSILLNMALRNRIGKNSKMFIQTVLGVNPRFRLLYLIDKGSHLGIGGKLDIFSFDFDKYRQNIRITNYQFTSFSASVFANANLYNLYNLRTGIKFERFRFKETYVQDSLGKYAGHITSYGNIFFSFNADTYDQAYFPNYGFQSSLNFKYIFNITSEDKVPFFSNAPIITFKFSQFFPINKKWVYNFGLYSGVTIGNGKIPIQHLFYLGGQNPKNYFPNFVPFKGLRFIQETGKDILVLRSKIRYNYFKNLYISASLNAGNIQNDLKGFIINTDWIIGYGVTLSYNSFIGPVQVSFMQSSKHSKPILYFNLGYWF